MSEPGGEPETDQRFPSTCWSRLWPGDPSARSAALEALAARYWRPIHAYLRCALARGDEEARDLAQDFFVWMIETDFVGKADPSRGRFRGFLKTALRHYVADRDREQRAHKRGGGRRFVPLLGAGSDSVAWQLPSGARRPDELLDEAWRAEIIAAALGRVEAELERAGRGVVFAVFRAYFLDPQDDVDYATLADRHAVSKVDVSNYLQRAKKLYRAELRELIAETVQSPVDLEDEIAWLLGHER